MCLVNMPLEIAASALNCAAHRWLAGQSVARMRQTGTVSR